MEAKCDLNQQERHTIKILNFISSFDGIINSEDNIEYILKQGIQQLIPKNKQKYLSVNKEIYPIKIIITKL